MLARIKKIKKIAIKNFTIKSSNRRRTHKNHYKKTSKISIPIPQSSKRHSLRSEMCEQPHRGLPASPQVIVISAARATK